ncbi:hypothetical protein, partial [Longimicrobium sp.]|uniref:hypothetical protein n=1 Tax=Longimicrobium sp. TaxID=2029185 RepID=UPI002E2F0F87
WALRIAWVKGRDPVSWAYVCLATCGAGLVLLLARRPARTQPGHVRPCAVCGEFNRWKAFTCAACGEPVAQEAARRRAVDLSGRACDAWLLGLFPWYGVIVGVAGLYMGLVGLWFTAPLWMAAWSVPRRSAPGARATLGVATLVLLHIAAIVVLHPQGSLAIATPLILWPAVRASRALQRAGQQDGAAGYYLSRWQQLSLHPPPELVPPSAAIPVDSIRHGGKAAAWRLFAIFLAVLLVIGIRMGGTFHLAFLLVAAAWRRGTRLGVLNAAELRVRDRRRPVFYFRSFRDDSTNVDPGALETLQLTPRTLEMVVADAAWRCGPVLAIGRPGEETPPLGFARESVGADAWQGTARERMDEARLVFVVAGPTEGVAWEMNAVASSGGLGRVILLVPPPQPRDGVRARWAAFLAHLDAPLRARLGRINPDRALAIVFPPEGEALAFTAAYRGVRAYETALHAAVAYVLEAGGDLEPAPTAPH